MKKQENGKVDKEIEEKNMVKPKYKPKLILFDFDYTLADSSKGVVICYQYALTQTGNSKVSEEVIKDTIGLELKEGFKRFIDNPEVMDECIALFKEKAEEVMVNNSFLLPMTSVTIRTLSKRGYVLGIVSTKYAYRIQEILKRNEVNQYFKVIIGGENVKNFKPAPEGVLKACDKIGIDPQETIFVGDTVVDIKAGKAAEVNATIGVLTGRTKKADFLTVGADLILNSILDLLSYLQ
ncbi:MAG: HAD family hydrolase [Candidatus Hermodarchaeota archaeon]